MPITLDAIPKSRRVTALDPEDIDQDVKDAVNEAYAYCQEHPDQRVSAKFESQEAADEFLFQARSYVRSLEPRLQVNGNTTKKGEARFTVSLWGADGESDAA